MSKDGHIGQAAMKADMDRKTARRYVAAGKLPSEMKQPRWWRTRPDTFAEDWPAGAARIPLKEYQGVRIASPPFFLREVLGVR